METNECTHAERGSQEHIMGSGSGDYYCRGCREAMPIIARPARCIGCNSTTSDIAPDPEHGMSWRCADCGTNWGWVRRR